VAATTTGPFEPPQGISRPLIGIIEPTYGRHDHAAINAALIKSVALAFPGEEMALAASPRHRRHIEQSRLLPPHMSATDIAVPRPGGISLRRFAAQWQAMRAMVQYKRPRAVILLSSGPETFFAARAIVAEFGAVALYVILHGNLNDAVGWRSRDPRRRLFDYRSGLTVARHPRIKLVVLEEHIRAAAIRLRLAPSAALLTWPLPLNEEEINHGGALRAGGAPVRIAFIGAATRNKGFDKFLALVRSLRDRAPASPGAYDFRFIGARNEDFPEAISAGIAMPAHPLERKEFIRRLCDIDYVVMPFSTDSYELTASASLLDCVSQAKPVISLNLPGVGAMAAQYGDIGFVCGSMAEMQDLLSSNPAVSDPTVYNQFHSRLKTISASRTPAGIAGQIRRDLATH
jgi:hypothetical protein